jgi:predicted nucleic acid-binding protein
MPDKLTISNTSPLLYLHLVKQLDLLAQLYGKVLVPPAVEAELQAGAEQGVDVPQVAALSWLKVTPLASDTSIPLVTDLGRGEAEVIALGLENPDRCVGDPGAAPGWGGITRNRGRKKWITPY